MTAEGSSAVAEAARGARFSVRPPAGVTAPNLRSLVAGDILARRAQDRGGRVRGVSRCLDPAGLCAVAAAAEHRIPPPGRRTARHERSPVSGGAFALCGRAEQFRDLRVPSC